MSGGLIASPLAWNVLESVTSSSNRTLGVRDEVPVEGFVKLSSLEAACRTAGGAMRGHDVLFGCGRSNRRRGAVQCGSRRAASRHHKAGAWVGKCVPNKPKKQQEPAGQPPGQP